jgi:hypothetical protein
MAANHRSAGSIVREIMYDGSVVIRDERCRFVFRRIGPSAVEILIAGVDNGQFGTTIIDEIALALFRERPLRLFVDASEASIPSASVTSDWARFLDRNRADLERVTILASPKPVALTMAILRHLSGTGDLIHILAEREIYESRKV